MQFALALPHYGFSMPDGNVPSVGDVVAVARRAEDLGFDAVYVSDHLFLEVTKYGGPPGRFSTPEAFGLLHAVAAGTERVTIGTLVLCSPFRNPAVLALQVKTLQDASGGRFVCGLGAGWYEAEFELAGLEFGTAGSRIDAMCSTAALLKEAGDAPSFIGGKGGPRILDAVARYADGWNVSWSATPEFVAERRAALDEACRTAGRDPGEVGISVGLYTLLAKDEADLVARFDRMRAWAGPGFEGTTLERWREAFLVGTIEETAELVRAYAAAGAREIIVSPAAFPFALFEHEQLDLVAELKEAAR